MSDYVKRILEEYRKRYEEIRRLEKKIQVTLEEYVREFAQAESARRMVWYANARIRYNEYRLKGYRDYKEALERSKGAFTQEEYEKIMKSVENEIEKAEKRIEEWKRIRDESTIKRDFIDEKIKMKEIVKVPLYNYARIMKDVRIYAKKKKASTPDPVVEVSVSICIPLPEPMSNKRIEEYVNSPAYKEKYPEATLEVMECDIREMLFASSYKALRKHTKWVDSVNYAEQQYEIKGIDPDEVSNLNEKRYWMLWYRPRTEYQHEQIELWLREVRAAYSRRLGLLTKIRQSKITDLI
jgi:hypothetical protein